MEIALTRQFAKQFAKLSANIQVQFRGRRDLFMRDPRHPLLRNHALSGEFAGLRSFRITGDYRVLYAPVSEDRALFVAIGTHAQLYE